MRLHHGEVPAADNAAVHEFGVITAAMLREAFDRWRIFKSGGWWWALRSEEVAVPAGPRSLIRPVLTAGSLIGLAEQLELQEHLRSLPTAELAAVWRRHVTAVIP